MNKAIFLDRDGVINLDHLPYQYRPEDFKILDGLGETLQELKGRGYIFIVISNQGGIGKGLYKRSDVEYLHQRLYAYLDDYNIELKEIYYCTHHPISGNCICRKPDSLLLEKGIARFNIDKSRSYFIGDMDRDIEAGKKAGLKSIKVRANDPLGNYIDEIE